tara:strand:- start:85 stop:285 length:201 start_codon:yes stop_codon:yes gene_type:complete
MKVGDLVMYKYDLDRQPPVDGAPVGIVSHIDPEEIGDQEEVLVWWSDDGALMNHSMEYLVVVNESR